MQCHKNSKVKPWICIGFATQVTVTRSSSGAFKVCHRNLASLLVATASCTVLAGSALPYHAMWMILVSFPDSKDKPRARIAKAKVFEALLESNNCTYNICIHINHHKIWHYRAWALCLSDLSTVYVLIFVPTPMSLAPVYDWHLQQSVIRSSPHIIPNQNDQNIQQSHSSECCSKFEKNQQEQSSIYLII